MSGRIVTIEVRITRASPRLSWHWHMTYRAGEWSHTIEGWSWTRTLARARVAWTVRLSRSLIRTHKIDVKEMP